MSRHYFETEHEGRPIQVVIGWDRPLRGFFMTIERLDFDPDAAEEADSDDKDDGEYLYENLSDLVSHPNSLDPYRKVLASLDIRVPESMFEQAQHDRDNNVGNRQVTHDHLGFLDVNGHAAVAVHLPF